MNLETISDLFDNQFNAFSGGVHKDEYEKSLYLTASQDIYYNALLAEFEATHQISIKLGRLITDEVLNEGSTTAFGGSIITFSNPIKTILRERVLVSSTDPLYDGRELEVHTERLAEIEDSLINPFRKPNGSKVLRALTESDASYINQIELYLATGLTLTNYRATVALRANPIILETLTSMGLEIDGESAETTNLSFEDDDIKNIIKIAVTAALQDMQVLAQPTPQPQQ